MLSLTPSLVAIVRSLLTRETSISDVDEPDETASVGEDGREGNVVVVGTGDPGG